MAKAHKRKPPSKKQIKAVHQVLYERKRLKRIVDDLHSIDVLLQLRNDSNPDAAPLWFLPATGEVSSSVKEAAQRCHSIAAAHRAMRSELDSFHHLPGNDKRDLQLGLAEQAAAWDKRGDAWAATSRPDADRIAADIASHQASALRAAQKVSAYLRHANEGSDVGEVLR